MRRTTWADCLRYGSGAQWRDDALDHRFGCKCALCERTRRELEPETQEADSAED